MTHATDGGGAPAAPSPERAARAAATLEAAAGLLEGGAAWTRGGWRRERADGGGRMLRGAAAAIERAALAGADGDIERRTEAWMDAAIALARTYDPGARCREECSAGCCADGRGLCAHCAARAVERANDGGEGYAEVGAAFARAISALRKEAGS